WARVQEQLASLAPIPEEATGTAHETSSLPGRDGAEVLPLPATLGRYQLLSRAGAGGMGTVYKALDPKLNRTVAVKVPHLNRDASKDDAVAQRFLREAQSAAKVEHQNVCPIYDAGEQDGILYVVMKW